jgi:hypothetical protein
MADETVQVPAVAQVQVAAQVTPAPVAAPGIAPSAGATTSEFSITKMTMMLTVVASVIGVVTDVLQSLSAAMPGSKWIGPLLTVTGLVGTVLTALGYQVTRAQVKVAAHAAAGAAAATTASADDAAAKLGQA